MGQIYVIAYRYIKTYLELHLVQYINIIVNVETGALTMRATEMFTHNVKKEMNKFIKNKLLFMNATFLNKRQTSDDYKHNLRLKADASKYRLM